MELSADFFEPALPLDEKRINVDPESRRIAVRIASWNDVHSGFNQAVRMPRDVNVEAAHVGSATLGDGSTLRVATLPMNVMHAPKNLDAMHAASWYEDTSNGVARVRYSTDAEGLRADGILFDDVDDAKLERLTAAAPSGDWRSAVAVRRPEDFEHSPADLVGACIVSIPGFSDTYAQSPGKRYALAASAHSIISFEEGAVETQSVQDWTGMTDSVTITSGLTLTAASDYEKPADCVGKCEGCKCTDEEREALSAAADEPDEDPQVTLSASALMRLRDKAMMSVCRAENEDDAEYERDLLQPAMDESREVLTAAGVLQANAAIGYDDVAGIHPLDRRIEIIEQRIGELEQLVADSILSM